ncbi:MAG TPA: hypothetical protein VF278_20495 [Pirellulales bacterium]
MFNYHAYLGHRKGWRAAALAVAALLLAAAAIVAELGRRDRKSAAPNAPIRARSKLPAKRGADAATGRPVSLRPAKRVRVALDPDDVRRALDKVRLHHPASLSILLHYAMVFGLDAPVPGYRSPDERPTVAALLYDGDLSRAYFQDRPVFVRTAGGLANRVRIASDAHWQIERQAHPGQLLAALARQGVPLARKLSVGDDVFSVEDILADATANFDRDAPQIEWTAAALAMYLPPRKDWFDQHGRRCSFDDLATELLRRDVRSRELSCAGIHVLEALVLLLRVDERYGILSSVQRQRTREYLGRHVAGLTKTQADDGGWSINWSDTTKVRPDVAPHTMGHQRVHVTGHHVDWMLMLPADMMPSQDVFDRAAAWLLASLLGWDQANLTNTYCPYSHAAHVIKTLTAE